MATLESIRLHGSASRPEPTAVTDELVSEIESRLGVKLPDAYIALMKLRNGGYMSQHLIKVEQQIPQPFLYYIDKGCIAVTQIFGLSRNEGEYATIAQNGYLLREWDLPAGLVLIDGDGHTWIALDYRERKHNPSVVFVVSDGPQIITIASDFAEFIERLVPDENVSGRRHAL
jgi:hypothetical protein